MILTEAIVLSLLKVIEKSLDIVLVSIQDQPQAERTKAWQRWFKFWDPVWKFVGLNPAEPPL